MSNNEDSIESTSPPRRSSVESSRADETLRLPHSNSTWQELHPNVRDFPLRKEAVSYLDKRPAPRKKGQVGYIRMNPSLNVARAASTDDEVYRAAKTVLDCYELRERFITRFVDMESPAIVPVVTPPCTGQMKQWSTEPDFAPWQCPIPARCSARGEWKKGVLTIYWDPENDGAENPPVLTDIPDVSMFLLALKQVMEATQNPEAKTFCYQRVRYIEELFSMHLMLNSSIELQEVKENNHRDFYNVRKVDTHVHHSACMHQKHLLRFIRKKYRTDRERVVAQVNGEDITLEQIFMRELKLTAYEASVDHLNVSALGSCFQRFDLFNSKYNPFGQKLLRDVFLKTSNHIEGAYLAELTREVMDDLEERKYEHVEWRVSIYGRSYDEWAKLAKWIRSNNLTSKRVRWVIQVPRLYHVYRKMGVISSVGELLRNVFQPVFDALQSPSEHEDIFLLLHQVVAWDSVDDESIVSKYTSEGGDLPSPDEYTNLTNPPYSYWAYYMYANIKALNGLMVKRGVNPLRFRPHCGEAGSLSHLAAMFLCADAINHGIMLRKSPVLRYFYYLTQMGLAMSPLSNNALFMDITKSPFYSLFRGGMNVSLSTDDPLMFHFTDEPLLEEFSVCAHVWKLSPIDLCEIARASVLQSGFEPQLKRHWLGSGYMYHGMIGNSLLQTNVSNIRLQFRADTLYNEWRFLRDILELRERGVLWSTPQNSLPSTPRPLTMVMSSLLPSAVGGEQFDSSQSGGEDGVEVQGDEEFQFVDLTALQDYEERQRSLSQEQRDGWENIK